MRRQAQPYSGRLLQPGDHPAGIEDSVWVEAFLQAAVQGGYRGLERVKASAGGACSPPTQRGASCC